MKVQLPRGLYAITDRELMRGRFEAAADAALRGGARCLQYRDKGTDASRRRDETDLLRRLCRRHDALLIVNDDLELAAHSGADGVHVGAADSGVADARGRLGPDALIGVSCYDSLQRALEAREQGADYIALGSFFASRTKPQARRAPLGLLECARAELDIPIVAIGGITPENGSVLIHAGADALAVISGVFAADDPAVAARAYSVLFDPDSR